MKASGRRLACEVTTRYARPAVEPTEVCAIDYNQSLRSYFNSNILRT